MSITRSNFERQYKHIGNVRHGVQTGPWRVEFDAEVDSTNVNYNKIYQGSVVSLNAAGKFIAGCTEGDGINHPVPFISMKNVFDPDVTTGIAGDVLPLADPPENTNPAYGYPVKYPQGTKDPTLSAVGSRITAIPTTSGYELETTEYNASATYNVNDGLIPADGDDLGKVTVATAGPGGAKPYIGFVTIPPAKLDAYGNKRLAFLANFIPAGINA